MSVFYGCGMSAGVSQRITSARSQQCYYSLLLLLLLLIVFSCLFINTVYRYIACHGNPDSMHLLRLLQRRQQQGMEFAVQLLFADTSEFIHQNKMAVSKQHLFILYSVSSFDDDNNDCFFV